MIKFEDFDVESILNECKKEQGYQIAKRSNFGVSLDATTMALDLKYMIFNSLPTEKEVDIINNYQEPSSGLFQEKKVKWIDKNNRRNLEMSAVYLTYHVSMLYYPFTIRPMYDYVFLKDFLSDSYIKYFIDEFIPWSTSTMGSGNIIDHYVSALRLQSLDQKEFEKSIDSIYSNLIRYESPNHGFFGSLKAQGYNGLVQGGYHLLRGTYFYDTIKPNYVDKKIDTVLRSYRNLDGNIFGYGQGEGCHDMDHFLLLEKLIQYSDHRLHEITSIAHKRLDEIIKGRPSMPGFAFNISTSIENHNRYNVTLGEIQGDLVGTVFYLQTIRSLCNIIGEEVNWNNSLIHG